MTVTVCRHYLDPRSLTAFLEYDQAKAESYCLGKIMSKEELTATDDVSSLHADAGAAT